ncbi:MAG: hypothetical protein KDK36_04885 [Leptospiraceae bacterium]|nr:hypothetical protein [Leptospiraceae bacterium]
MSALKFIIVLILFITNCAFMNRDNRILTNKLDETINPESTSSKVILAPIAIPLGTVSLLTDALVLHPISRIPYAIKDTYDILWENPGGGIVRQTFLFFPKLIFTPITFAASWFIRSIFDV